MIFKCKTCEERECRIQDLQSQIVFLRSLVQPNFLPGIAMEANKILEGASMPVIDLNSSSAEREAQDLEIEREAVSILTGNYTEA